MTLANHLRSLPDEELAALMCARPDLALPVPGDFPALANRAQSRLSVARALEDLDQFTLEMLDALRLLGPEPTTFQELTRLVAGQVPDRRVRQAVDALRRQSLVYGPDTAIHVVLTVAECCSPYPGNLGRPAAELDPVAAELVGDPAALRRTVAEAPEPARLVLDRLAAGPPVGKVSGARQVTTTDSPVRWLIARRLLVPIDENAVELPREVGLLLRQDTGPLGRLHPDPPPWQSVCQDTDKADMAGAGQAMEVVRQTESVLEALSAEPAAVLRSGGMGVRELRRVSRSAGLDESLAALLLEVSAAAGLLVDDQEADPRWLPTSGYDAWRDADLAARWTWLASAWLSMTRQPGLTGNRDERDRPVNVLAAELERIAAPVVRRDVLSCLADLPKGWTASAGQIAERLAWQAPRRGGRHRDESVRWALGQAAALGVTGLGGLTSYARLLIGSGPEDTTEALAKLLPEPVSHILVQADLTVVVPGPPEATLAAELSLTADPESAGGAAVYRVTPASVRRALDAGMTGDDLQALFRQRSVTPVPQALRYLIEDTARRHGRIRIGSAGAYLRGDDEARLAELLADRRLERLALRRLAPTVLITPYAPARLLAVLREHGYAPVPEDPTGVVMLARPDVPRAPARPRTPRPAGDLNGLDQTRALAVVAAVRRGEESAHRVRRAPVSSGAAGSLADALTVLREAQRNRGEVVVWYVDAHGGDASRLVRPVSLGSGYLRAEDTRTDTVHTFALRRITSVSLPD
ncbi:MAG TPA: helicase-associated domain-containing protein [Micromonosporaceae bacterium]|nr:helicase-associated domain-containing protein [Micromonosporaceae bacterium]